VNYSEELQKVIGRLHGSHATHVETVPIKEEFQGQTVWEGEVEVFDLHDHPKTRRHVTVLHIPSATSPRKAVQVSIVSDYREQKGHAEN
jgi:hypothetical protein